MRHFVQYHNVEKMGGPPSRPFTVLTNKPLKDNLIGDRVWLVLGAGTPKRFLLHSTFVVEGMELTAVPGFTTEVRASSGKLFEPMLDLTDEYWLPDLLQQTGNFAFGLTDVTSHKRLVGGLRTAGGC